MLKQDQSIVTIIEKHHLQQDLFNGNFGLEKENVRATDDGKLAVTPHPKVLGDKGSHPYITTDFSESQVEIITPPMSSIEDAYNMLDTLHNIVSLNIGQELLWPQSTPPILPHSEKIPIASFGETKRSIEMNRYREGLAKKYGSKKQMISGIHFNFSFCDDFLRRLHQYTDETQPFKEFRSQLYLKVIRNTLKHSWFLIKLLGSSPAVHESYSDHCSGLGKRTSIRNGTCGYNNETDLYVPMDNLNNYVQGLDRLIATGYLTSAKEYYSLVRPKNSLGDHDQLLDTGIEYIELRMIDINPLYKLGISKEDLYFIHTFLLLMAVLEDGLMDQEALKRFMENNRKVADKGHDTRMDLEKDHRARKEQEKALKLIKAMEKVAGLACPADGNRLKAVQAFEHRLRHPEMLYAHIIYDQICEQGFIPYHLGKAREYLKESKSKEFNVIGYEDMELSTQILILDALRRGIKVEVLDRFENFIQLSQGKVTEIVKQATKTSKDSYSSVLVMENKIVTKKVLDAAAIRTPEGGIYEDFLKALSDYKRYENTAIVIKPNSTNFGIGITIFKESFSKKDYEKALKHAFSFDSSVLIESFIEGKEYRIFVIGDRVVAAMHRVPANVTGDGHGSISELAEEKNKSPLRGTGYRKPLQKISLGLEEEMFLAQSGLTFDSVPSPGEIVFLRENSNISTGGDSMDMTDRISPTYKEIAVKAAKAVGASITGVDLITTDITAEDPDNYSIIELNFNPAIHIHCYPYEGLNRQLGDKILDHLGFQKFG